jgi:hypothetical protein
VKMAFRSYAQNFEDLILYRGLGKVGRDFYIDIRAKHPEIDSVSKAFFTGVAGLSCGADASLRQAAPRGAPG